MTLERRNWPNSIFWRFKTPKSHLLVASWYLL